MIRHVIAFFLAVMLAGYPVLSAFSQDCNPEIEACTYPMNQGDVAPFDGVLLNDIGVAEIVAKVNSLVEECENEIKRRTEIQKLYYEKRIEILLAEQDAYAREQEIKLVTKQKEVDELVELLGDEDSNDIWWFVGGAGASAVVFGTIIAVIVAVD